MNGKELGLLRSDCWYVGTWDLGVVEQGRHFTFDTSSYCKVALTFPEFAPRGGQWSEAEHACGFYLGLTGSEDPKD